MAQVKLSLIPQPTASAIVDDLEGRGLSVLADAEPHPDQPYVLVVGVIGADVSGWALVTAAQPNNCLGVVALTDRPQLSAYRRAYKARAAVAQVDTSPSAMGDVIAARLRGEILVPAGVLAACLDAESESSLSAGEKAVLQHISDGLSVAATAEHTFYSERHVRRLLQSILAKAGTSDRRAAVVHFQSELG